VVLEQSWSACWCLSRGPTSATRVAGLGSRTVGPELAFIL
jgi:hypothetical protein